MSVYLEYSMLFTKKINSMPSLAIIAKGVLECWSTGVLKKIYHEILSEWQKIITDLLKS
jgi:hypothetical protein